MNWLVDDQHLASLLRTGRRPRGFRRRDALFTTGYWYVRLCIAALASADRTGSLSGHFSALPPTLRERALARVVELPEDVGLVSLRELGPTIGRLRIAHDLNVLASEALAAAVTLDARVLLGAPSPRLQHALASERRECVVAPALDG